MRSRVLHLGTDGTEHLYRLRAATSPSRSVHEDSLILAERMTALVEAVRPNPAYALDRLSNVVAANPEGLAIYDGFADLPPGERNTCRYLMTEARAREIFVEWEEIARGAVAHLRAVNAENLEDPELQAFVAELHEQSALFGEWREDHIVERRGASLKHLRTQDGGIVARRYEVLHLPDEGVRVTIWLPESQMWVDGQVLTQVSDAVIGRSWRGTQQLDVACSWPSQPERQTDQRGLARAVLPQQSANPVAGDN